MIRMKLRLSKNLVLVAIGALALGASVVGCTTDTGSPGGFGSNNTLGEDAAGGNADAPGAPADGSAGSGSSGGGNSSGSGSGSGSNSSSGSSGSSGSNGGSGSSGSSGSSSGSAGADAGLDATGSPDVNGNREASALPDVGAPGSDAGLCADQAAWLTPMNQARAMVNAGEPPLVCDPIAAQVALNYANQCNYAHNANRNTDYTSLGGTGGLGENIAAGAPTETIAAAVSSWVGEAMYYDHTTNTCSAPTGQSCGHYTQIVWKATTGVGCAHVSCTTNSPFGTTGGGKWDFSVCDYSPPGNYVGQPPY
jgi:pathogenesis-related protein 1